MYACNAEDLGLIPESGRSSGEGNGHPLQYSCLESSMDRGAWWATVYGEAKESDMEVTKPPPPADVGNLISSPSSFSKSSLNIWEFTVHILLKPGLENFEHYFASM